MSRELRASLNENANFVEGIEQVLQEDVPAVFIRYQGATEEERSKMERRFHLAKSQFRIGVKTEWYQYRSASVEAICDVVERHLTGVEEVRHMDLFLHEISDRCPLSQDRNVVYGTSTALSEALPALQNRKEELHESILREEARRADIDACDPEHLAGLREAISEQRQVNCSLKDPNDC